MGIVTEGILNMPFDLAMGDEFMRRQYYSTVRAEIAGLQEQVETQIAGHRLTAKEATANLIRANKAEAGLEEMTRSCLAERAGRLAAEARKDRLREALERILNAAGCGVDLYNDAPGRDAIKAARAALQKEPQP